MDRRTFLIGAGSAAGVVLLPGLASAEANRIDWYTGSDTNILDFWSNIVKPRFEAANPGITLNLVDGGDGAGLEAIAERALRGAEDQDRPAGRHVRGIRSAPAQGRHRSGPVDRLLQGGALQLRQDQPAHARDIAYNLPWHGSQVLLAYDTTKLKPADAPKTWADLVAWIKANPGQFIYSRPDKGGSGNNFIQRAVYQANGLDPSKFTVDNFSPEKAKAMLDPAWELLKDIGPYTFDKGAYTSGNTQSVQLLVADRRDHDHGLVGPGAVVDRAGRAAGDHRPGAARRPGVVGRLSRRWSSSPTASTTTRRSSSPTSS